jgi:hypothetical protein
MRGTTMLWEVFVTRFEIPPSSADRRGKRARRRGCQVDTFAGCASAMRKTGARACAIVGSAKFRRAVVWSYAPSRIWLHTDTWDHPKAQFVYQRAGFRTYVQRVETFPD